MEEDNGSEGTPDQEVGGNEEVETVNSEPEVKSDKVEIQNEAVVQKVVVKGDGAGGSGGSGGAPVKENVILVMGKVDGTGAVVSGGEVKLLSKNLVIGGAPGIGGTAAILKKTLGNTILKVKPGMQGQVLKKSVVLARPGGVGQLIVQPSHGSAPVVLTQKVAAGGVLTSPVVSTGRVATSPTKIITSSSSSGSPTNQEMQDVRVDNWGIFCLQRLQAFYDKGDYCDLTLRFHSSQEIKVHRVVVNLCTEYFSNLEKLYGLIDGTLVLPKDVEFQTMQTIIRFFYTGKLEVRGSQSADIYRTVKMMNIQILIKLMEAHARKPIAQLKKDAGKAVVLKPGEVQVGKEGHVRIHLGNANQQQTSFAVPVTGSKALQVASPGMKLPPGVKAKTVLARVQSVAAKGSPSPKTTPKKLPIWKERKYSPAVQEPPKLEKWQIKKEEPARPTRFEWGDPDDFDPFFSSPSMTNHALMEKQKEKHSTPTPTPTTRKAEDIFDSVKQSQAQGVKRPKSPESITSTPTKSPSEPPAKILKLDSKVSEGDSDGEAVQLEDDPLADLETEEADNTEVIEKVAGPSLTLNVVKSPTPSPTDKRPVPILKPALKSPGSKTPKDGDSKGKEGTPQKTVRFAPEVEKENAEKPSTSSSAPSGVITLPISSSSTSPAQATSSKKIITTDGSGDHSKLISELMRRYPDLIKDGKNVKLKIIQKGGDVTQTSSPTKDAKSKVSYVLLKSTSSPDSSCSTVLKKSPAQSSVSKFWDTDKTPKKPSPAENTTGPWLCERCGEGENIALQFDTYYDFRRHLVEIHQERIDARICEYCGQKASKRNLLLYHLYTKHGVQPPKNCTFPHCDRCDYVALSESLLTKHKQNHDVSKEHCCTICNASFKTNSALQGHMTADLHRNKETKVYECPYCRKPFVRNINLKAHIRSCHRDVARFEEMEDPRLPTEEFITKRFITTTTKKRGFPAILATSRAGSSNSGMVEFVHDVHTVSYVTADGQPIEILDPSTLSSLPLTLVSAEDDMVGTAVTTIGGDSQTTQASAEYVQAGEGSSQQMFVMDGTPQGAVEVDVGNMNQMGLTLASDGTMVYEGDEQNFIVQDMQGNQYRRITGIDETGKPVMFLQLIGDAAQGMSQAVLEESVAVDGSGNGQMFVSGTEMQIPVSTDGGEGQQVIYASAAPDGTFVEMVPDASGNVVMSEAVITSQEEEPQQQHLQLVQHENENADGVEHEELEGEEPVEELHIVLDQEQSKEVQEEVVEEHEDGMEIVEVQQPGTYTELQLQDQYGEAETIETTEIVEEADGEGEEEAEAETQQMEIDENSQQLQIDEGEVVAAPTPVELKMERVEEPVEEEEENEEHEQETQVVTEENMQESIELVEGQTLTLIEDEDGTQTLEVGEGSVEESSA